MSAAGPPGPPSSNDDGFFSEPGDSGEFVEHCEPEHHSAGRHREAIGYWGEQVWLYYARDAIDRLRRRAREIVQRPPEPVIYRSASEFTEDIQPYAGFPPLCPMYGLGCLGSHRDVPPAGSNPGESSDTAPEEDGDLDDEHREAS